MVTQTRLNMTDHVVTAGCEINCLTSSTLQLKADDVSVLCSLVSAENRWTETSVNAALKII